MPAPEQQTTRRLRLIQHAQPQIDLAQPAATWRLSQSGIHSCQAPTREVEPFLE